MLNRYARALFGKILAPVARLLLRLGISPDAVTLVGTLGVCFGALAFYPRGEFLVGTLVITAFVFSHVHCWVIISSGRAVNVVSLDLAACLGKILIVSKVECSW